MSGQNTEHPKHKFNLGDLVVIKSYPETDPIEGDPLHIPPIMVVVGIEIENKNKKTHDPELGLQIAERVKYHLIWFDNKKSCFVEKVMYQSFLRKIEYESPNEFSYMYGELAQFRTTKYELLKVKKSISDTSTERKENGNTTNIETEQSLRTPLVTFTCPDLVITGVKKNTDESKFDDFGNKILYKSERIVKVMWFNPNLQKYSEAEIPQECLINKDTEVHEKEA